MSSSYTQIKNGIKIKKVQDGQVHSLVSRWMTDAVIALALLVGFYGVISWDWNLLEVISKLGCVYIGSKLATSYAGPDCDLPKSFAVNHWKGLSWIWFPYSRWIVRGHRGTLSHGLQAPRSLRQYRSARILFPLFGFILGTLTRLIYLTCIVLFVCLVADWVVGTTLFSDGALKFVLSEVMLWLSIGVAFSDAVHTRMDLLTTKKR